jgi:uncharacterized repeat protein (TIGR04138 family)
MSEAVDFWERVETLRMRDQRHPREAYAFVMAALGHTLERLPAERRASPVLRHVTGLELVAGLLDLARQEFGFLAWAVLGQWRLRTGLDVGQVVFQLVEAQVLSRREEDRLEDFARAPDFRAVLEEDFDWSRLFELPGEESSRPTGNPPETPAEGP